MTPPQADQTCGGVKGRARGICGGMQLTTTDVIGLVETSAVAVLLLALLYKLWRIERKVDRVITQRG